MNFNNTFLELSEFNQLNINGGEGWPGSDLIYAVFNCGRELGKSIGNLIWR